jgi:hypothetical protein
VRAAEYVRLLPQAVRELERRAAIGGVPVPRCDAEPIANLVAVG